MNTSRRVLTIVCLGLSLLLVLVVRFELKSNAASVNRDGASLVAIVSPLGEEPKPSLARRSFWYSQQTQPPAPKEKTIGEMRKNIRVLTDLPDSQLIPMMNLFAASLGVRCTHCHVNKDGQWNYPADEKPEKNTAREMIAMTLNINKTTFKGTTEVGCFTCHRGRTNPMSVPALPLPQPTPRPAQGGPGGRGGPGAAGAPGAAVTAPPATAPTATAAPPTADDILNKYVAAIGGQAAIDKLKTRTMKGTYAAANGMSATFEVEQGAPDKFHLTFSLPQGQRERGFDGAAGWEKGPNGVTDLVGPQLADMKSAFSLFSDLKLKEQFTRMNVRKDKLDGRDVYMIVATRVDGKRERLYFDAETGLLLRRSSSVQTPIGVIPQETNYEDYRDVDGVKVPFTISVLTIDQGSTATRKYTEIKSNPPVDDSIFNRPPAPPPAPATVPPKP
jgi:hypothetical protein